MAIDSSTSLVSLELGVGILDFLWENFGFILSADFLPSFFLTQRLRHGRGYIKEPMPCLIIVLMSPPHCVLSWHTFQDKKCYSSIVYQREHCVIFCGRFVGGYVDSGKIHSG